MGVDGRILSYGVGQVADWKENLLLVQDGKPAHRLAEEIERDILARGWPVGANLGVETELVERYGVGRDILRQAIALVVQGGLATVRRGREGGLIVAAPSESTAAASLRTYLDASPLDYDQVAKARLEFEDLGLMLAIRRHSAEDAALLIRHLARLEASNAAGPGERLHLVEEAFRDLIHAAKNPYLTLIIMTLFGLAPEVAGTGPTLNKLVGALCERRITQLRNVIGRNFGAALAENGKIHELRLEISRLSSEFVTETQGALDQRLSDAVARDIKQRVLKGKLEPGDRLGSQSELMATYGVSKGAIRDAIRILEQHSIVRAVRGKTGGVFVSKPRADSVLRTVSLHLRARQLTKRAIEEVGGVLDAFLVEAAACKFSETEPLKLAPLLDAPPYTVPLKEKAISHYVALIELADDPLISVLVTLQASLVEILPARDDVAATDIARHWNELVAAIQVGDSMRARASMHLLRRSHQFRLPPVAAIVEPQITSLADAAETVALRKYRRPSRTGNN